MARLVKMEGKEPYKLEVKGETFYICTCGLSRDLPFCDGSHKRTEGEEEGKLYIYDNGGRVEIELK